MFKLYSIFSMEAVKAMKGSRGKLAAQAGHAYLHSYLDALDRFPKQARAYFQDQRAFKICLAVPGEDELVSLRDAYQEVCGVSLVTDAALTVFEHPMTTCLGIGPIHVDKIGDDLKGLKVLT